MLVWSIQKLSVAEISPGELSEQGGHERGGEDFEEHLRENTRKTQRQRARAGSSTGRKPNTEASGSPERTLTARTKTNPSTDFKT